MRKIKHTDEQPLAIQHLRSLHKKAPSMQLKRDLRSFNAAKGHRLDVFTEGVLLFTRIANLSPFQRADYYGDQFLGLHYNNDLAKLWNLSSPESIKAHQLNHICPAGWDYALEDGYFTLVYRGDNPRSALDKLLQGPTVIDCGMFCQLSIWFGIKYVLGEEVFNEVFGRAPFYLTQLVYNPTAPEKPYMGNPLYPFFQDEAAEEKAYSNSVSIAHVHNHKLYQIKHPGGNYGGDNCVVIAGQFIIFDPTLKVTSSLDRRDVEQLLLRAFNAEQDFNDEARLYFYGKADRDSIHPKIGMNYGTLIEMARSCSSFTAKSIELDSQATSLQIKFNFDLFCSWVAAVQSPTIRDVDYSPLLDDQLTPSKTLVGKIPYENRTHMSFSNFTVRTHLQREMRSISQKFCLDVMHGCSVCTVLTGKAGIGKTASAVSCAKELSSRGKHVIWISEVMVRGWTDKAESMEELEACRDEIRKLLASKPDAVFLDDDNLVGYSGRVLLEEIYMWYTTTPGTGLFITSNEPVTFKDCYGLKLDKKYHFPPFPGYFSPQYRNTMLRSGMNGECMRARPSLSIMEISAPERITALSECRSGASVGIIVDAKYYESGKGSFSDVELVPAFPKGIFVPMTQSLMRVGTLGPTFNDLSLDQRKYTRRFPVSKYKGGKFTGIHWYDGINVKAFEKTDRKIIVVELLDDTHWSGKEIIQDHCLAQLLRVINYAHDCGGKRVVLLNNTKFSDGEMLSKIKDGIPEREKERTLARIDALLFSPELAVSEQDEKVIERSLTRVSVNRFFEGIIPKFALTYFLLSIFQQLVQSSKGYHQFCSEMLRQSGMFSTYDYLSEHRHDSPEAQREYDQQFGLVLRE